MGRVVVQAGVEAEGEAGGAGLVDGVGPPAVGPVGRDDGGEEPVLHVRQGPVLVTHEVDEGRLDIGSVGVICQDSCGDLGGLEDPETPDAGRDSRLASPGGGGVLVLQGGGGDRPGVLHLGHPHRHGAGDEGVVVFTALPTDGGRMVADGVRVG